MIIIVYQTSRTDYLTSFFCCFFFVNKAFKWGTFTNSCEIILSLSTKRGFLQASDLRCLTIRETIHPMLIYSPAEDK